MNSRVYTALAVLVFIITLAESHTWLDCIKVTEKSDYINYPCGGYGRGYPGRLPGVNIDVLYTYKILNPPQNQLLTYPICDPVRQANANTYTAQFPMAQANAGDTLTISYTPNGHKTGPGPATTPYPTNWTIQWTGQAGTQLTQRGDLLSMQHVLAGPSRFDNECRGVPGNNVGSDGQPCYGSFTIPSNTPAGIYSFVWYWIFDKQPGTIEEYTTCFDVKVGNPAPPPPTTTTSSSSSTTTTTGSTSTTGHSAATSASGTTSTSSNFLVEVTVTASLPVAPTSFDVESFVSNIAKVLGIPAQSIMETNVMLDKSTTTTTVITFVLSNTNGVDPVNAAERLKSLAQSSDPRIRDANLTGLQVLDTSSNNVNNPSTNDSSLTGLSLLVLSAALILGSQL